MGNIAGEPAKGCHERMALLLALDGNFREVSRATSPRAEAIRNRAFWKSVELRSPDRKSSICQGLCRWVPPASGDPPAHESEVSMRPSARPITRRMCHCRARARPSWPAGRPPGKAARTPGALSPYLMRRFSRNRKAYGGDFGKVGIGVTAHRAEFAPGSRFYWPLTGASSRASSTATLDTYSAHTRHSGHAVAGVKVCRVCAEYAVGRRNNRSNSPFPPDRKNRSGGGFRLNPRVCDFCDDRQNRVKPHESY